VENEMNASIVKRAACSNANYHIFACIGSDVRTAEEQVGLYNSSTNGQRLVVLLRTSYQHILDANMGAITQLPIDDIEAGQTYFDHCRAWLFFLHFLPICHS
jgi:hypothetical protein